MSRVTKIGYVAPMVNLVHLPLNDTLIVAAFLQLGVFVAFLVFNRRGDWKHDMILAGVLLFTAVPVISTFILAQEVHKQLFPLAHIGNNAVFIVGPLLFLYLRRYVRGRFFFGRHDRVHFVLLPVAVALFVSLALLQSRNYSYQVVGSVSALSLFAYTAWYFVLALRMVVAGREGSVNACVTSVAATSASRGGAHGKRPMFWPIFLFVSYLTLFLGRFVIFVTWDIFGRADLCPYTYNLYFMSFILFIHLLVLVALRSAQPFVQRPKYQRSNLTEAEKDQKAKQIRDMMETNKPFLDPSLSLESLALSLNLTRNQLSQIINERFSMNFIDFINAHRVRQVMQLLRDEGETRTILDLSAAAGFNSKSTFNDAFKKHVGTSPRQYQKNSRLKPAT